MFVEESDEGESEDKINRKFTFISIGIIFIIILSILFLRNTSFLEQKRSCQNIESNSPELTFQNSYCLGDQCATICDKQGENCRNVKTKEECEKIDVIAGNDLSKWGQDGKPDCVWTNENSGDPCKPNK